MAIYIVFMLLGILFTMFFGAIGYFICYLHEEKKKQKKTKRFNPMASAGWFSF